MFVAMIGISMEFREATPQERMRYYHEEWDPSDVPRFITDSIEEREFAFDHNGQGYNDRYNAFHNVHELETKMKTLNPYAVCASTAYYERPQQREGWTRAELVFDIDAKDQPVRSCDCEPGSICETCLEEGKELALTIMDTLRDDFAIRDMHMAYSGRGYHIHVLDENVLPLENRSAILEYVMGAVMPTDFQMMGGYARTWRRMLALIISKMDEKDLSFLTSPVATSVIEHRPTILRNLEARKADFLNVPGVGKTSRDKFLERCMELNGQTVDGKVTIDTKRILRLPSTLHSKISMICMLVDDPETFDPLSKAVPRFVEER